MRVGVLTGGGDCPGLNAVIRGIVRKGVPDYGYSFLGFRDGWRGPLEALTKPLDIPAVRGLLPRAARSSAARAPTRSRSPAASRRSSATCRTSGSTP